MSHGPYKHTREITRNKGDDSSFMTGLQLHRAAGCTKGQNICQTDVYEKLDHRSFLLRWFSCSLCFFTGNPWHVSHSMFSARFSPSFFFFFSTTFLPSTQQFYRIMGTALSSVRCFLSGRTIRKPCRNYKCSERESTNSLFLRYKSHLSISLGFEDRRGKCGMPWKCVITWTQYRICG